MRKRKILLTVLPISLFTLLILIIMILCFTTDVFVGKKQAFYKYFLQNKEIFTILENANLEEQREFKKNNSYQSRGELLLSIQNNENTQKVKATTASKHDANNGRTYSEMNIKNGEADLLSISYMNSGDIYAIKCEDILKKYYIGFQNNNLQEFTKKMGAPNEIAENIPNRIELDSIQQIWNITDEQKQHIMDTYSKIITKNITKDKYAKLGRKTILVDGINYKTNAYQVTLDKETIKQIIIDCLTTLKNDNITLTMISDKLSNIGMTSQYINTNKIIEMIDAMIQKYQSINSQDSNMTKIIVYADNGKTIRTEIINHLNTIEEIAQRINSTIEDDKIALRIDTFYESKITIDKLSKENILKTTITMEQNQTNVTENKITGEKVEGNLKSSTSQLIIQKNMLDDNITNVITIIPDVKNMNQMTTINTTMGKLKNGVINNSTDITISYSRNENSIETVRSSYIQNVEEVSQVDETLELNNLNTIIINNYPKEKLEPFLMNVVKKINQVIPSKIGQLGIEVNHEIIKK